MLSDAERQTLENWAKRRKTAQGLALRARIVLACAEGHSKTAVAARLRVSRVAAQMLPPGRGVSRIRWWVRNAGRCWG